VGRVVTENADLKKLMYNGSTHEIEMAAECGEHARAINYFRVIRVIGCMEMFEGSWKSAPLY
jgi:hypothetical protein